MIKAETTKGSQGGIKDSNAPWIHGASDGGVRPMVAAWVSLHRRLNVRVRSGTSSRPMVTVGLNLPADGRFGVALPVLWSPSYGCRLRVAVGVALDGDSRPLVAHQV